jgi:outer membrane protein assembly factor BamB
VGIGGWEIADHMGGPAPKKLAAFTLPAVKPGKLAWKFDTGASVTNAVQSGNRVFVATNGNKILALNATTGKQLWAKTVTSELNQSLQVSGNTVVVAGGNGPFGLNVATGKQVWSVKQEDADWLLMSGGVAYFGYAAKDDTNSGVTALDPATGIMLWTNVFDKNLPGGSDVGGQMTVADGVLYTATDNGYLYTYGALNGKVKHFGRFPKFGAGTVAAIKGVCYAGCDPDKGTVLALNTTTGKTLWQTDLGKVGFAPYTATDGHLIFCGTVTKGNTANGDSLVALNPADGKKVWGTPIRAGANQGPVVSGGAVYTGGGIEGSTGILQAWQAGTGKQLWEYTVADSLGDITAYTGSRVYVGAGGVVYSIGA